MAARIYKVIAAKPDGPKPRLVKASNQTQALKHVVEDTLRVQLASQDDLVSLVATGTVVENAADDGGNASKN